MEPFISDIYSIEILFSFSLLQELIIELLVSLFFGGLLLWSIFVHTKADCPMISVDPLIHGSSRTDLVRFVLLVGNVVVPTAVKSASPSHVGVGVLEFFYVVTTLKLLVLELSWLQNS
jgi:hypothetical protein